MKKYLFLFLISFWTLRGLRGHSQTCAETMKSVKSSGYGTTYTSYNSEAISKVTFYQISIDYKTYYFAIVCFKQKYTYQCKEYIYQVGSSTELKYSINYLNSAGKAYWEYIHPYRKILGCAPDFEE